MKNNQQCILLSGFILNDNNRGSAALGYGSISFLEERGYVSISDCFCMLSKFGKNPLRWKGKIGKKQLNIGGKKVVIKLVNYFEWEYVLYFKYSILLPFSPLRSLINRLKIVAATNGGDGFSDIYGKEMFYNRLKEIRIAMKEGKPLLFMPQTIGPFSDIIIRDDAIKILRYANKIFVRDKKYVRELDSLSLNYELTKDLSAFMQPEPWNINVKPNSIGINVSGLCYSNRFVSLSNQFAAYPELINRLIVHFQAKGKTIYLIPHSYHYGYPEPNNDDIVACQMAYDKLEDKKNVIFVNQNLISPQIKYLISKMSFFIGTRMHANFAAIYTNVPVFGLAYSYKFEGAFDSNGLDGKKQTSMINNIGLEDIDDVINKVEAFYKSTL